MISCLEYAGYLVVGCINGQEAINLLKQDMSNLPKLILLDMMMPVMDGSEFRKVQLADDKLSHIPIIVLSAGNSLVAHDNIFEDVCFMSKPFELDELLENIESTILE